MKSTYTNGGASCRVSTPTSVPGSMRKGLREVSHLETKLESRRKGRAAQLMFEVCDDADSEGIVLMMAVAPFGDPDLGASQLEDWYARRFGFQTIQESPKLMARMPGATPRLLNPVVAAIGQAIEAM